MASPLTGSCLCGNIRYSLAHSAEPIYNVVCHCVNCKKSSGTHMVNSSIFLKSQFTLESGTPKVYEDVATDSGTPLHRHFCGDCGSSVYVTKPQREDMVSIMSGTFDQAGTWWKPNKEVYAQSKSHWLPDLGVIEKEGVLEEAAEGTEP